jgi:chromosome segregation ATPase
MITPDEKRYIDLTPDKCIAILSRHILIKHKSDGSYFQGRPINPIESVLTEKIVSLVDSVEAAETRAEKAEAEAKALRAIMADAVWIVSELRDRVDAQYKHITEIDADRLRLEAERDYQIRRVESLQTTLNTVAAERDGLLDESRDSASRIMLLVSERDELRRQLEQAQERIAQFEHDETPFGHDGLGDEVEQ